MADKNDIVMINLDRPRMLWFGHKAMKTLGAMTGKKLGDLLENLELEEFEDLETMFYCGLLTDAKKNNETLKMEDMEDLLDYVPFMELPNYLTKALGMATAGPGVEDTKNEKRIAEKSEK